MTEIFNFYDYLSKVMALLCHKALTLMPRKCDAPPYSRRVTLFGDVPLNAQIYIKHYFQSLHYQSFRVFRRKKPQLRFVLATDCRLGDG